MRRQSATIETASGTRAEVAVTLTAPSERQLVVIRSALAVRRICCAGLQSSATPVPLADIDRDIAFSDPGPCNEAMEAIGQLT